MPERCRLRQSATAIGFAQGNYSRVIRLTLAGRRSPSCGIGTATSASETSNTALQPEQHGLGQHGDLPGKQTDPPPLKSVKVAGNGNQRATC